MSRCKCGSHLQKITARNAYGDGAGAHCDGCRKSIASWEVLYHCPRGKTYQHPGGYDHCSSCYRGSSVTSEDSTINGVIGQMSLQALPSIDNKWKQMIQKQRAQIQETTLAHKSQANNMEREISKLKAKIEQQTAILTSKIAEARLAENACQQYQDVQRKIESIRREVPMLRQNSSEVQKENASLKFELSKLLDEKKEMEVAIVDLSEEVESFRARQKQQCLDESNFLWWNWEEVLMWMLSIERGFFKKYEAQLRQELNACELNGNDLQHLTTNDIRGMGIKKFGDAKKLEQYIQLLINKNKHEQEQPNEGKNDVNTEYIHK